MLVQKVFGRVVDKLYLMLPNLFDIINWPKFAMALAAVIISTCFVILLDNYFKRK